MGNKSSNRWTRRQYLLAGTAAAASGLVAGCSGDNSQETPGETDDGAAPTATVTPTPGDAGATATPGGDSTATATPALKKDPPYRASISPVGEVTVESEPTEIFTLLSHHTEMALALGKGDAVNTSYAPGYVDSLVSAFTPRLAGVSVDWGDLPTSWGMEKEAVYDLESDIHLADPAEVATMDGWDASDVTDVADAVGPWFGNSLSGAREDPPQAYAGDYEYYGLWEIFERVASALNEPGRYRALASLRDEMLSTIESSLPPESERPAVAMILPSTSDDSMWAYHTNADGYYASHTRPFGATDAMAAADVEDGARIDNEALVAADPDVLIVLGGLVDYHDIEAVRESLADDPVASQVTAVQNERVYAQGTRHQGPLVNLFQLEATAKQLFPDEFGAWPDYENGQPYPEIPADERLLDYDRAAAIINGEF